MSAYKYDIFLSVKSDKTFDEWVADTFMPLFESFVRQDIISECQRLPLGSAGGMYYYRKALAPGDPWPEELREAIQCSRLAIALCSPEYFYSEWCLTEFYSFLERTRLKKAKVLVPISIHNSSSFPADLKGIQRLELADYVIVGPGFKETKKYTLFQEELKTLSKNVARLVKEAPLFEEWPIIAKQPPGTTPTLVQETIST